jgi:L-aminopeptidase/D-esterase-like protein
VHAEEVELAAQAAVPEGNVGAGAGATVGKARGYQHCTKSGQGSAAVRLRNGLIVGALAAVNAFGDIVDPLSGRIVAGVRADDGGFVSTLSLWKDRLGPAEAPLATNTTIAVVATNANLDKSRATKVAQMAQNGLARVIHPCHTMYDGDTVFALATGEISADVSLVGTLAQEMLAQAILRAVYAAETTQGLPNWRDAAQPPGRPGL